MEATKFLNLSQGATELPRPAPSTDFACDTACLSITFFENLLNELPSNLHDVT